MGYSSKSPWLIHYDGSSCNGCDIEVLDSLTPRYDIERFGIINTGNPKHADIFLVTGSVNHQNINVVKHIYDQMLEPKVVVACGACACTGGVFRECYNVLGGVDKAIPILDEKAERMRRGLPPVPPEEAPAAVAEDAPAAATNAAPGEPAGAGAAAQREDA